MTKRAEPMRWLRMIAASPGWLPSTSGEDRSQQRPACAARPPLRFCHRLVFAHFRGLVRYEEGCSKNGGLARPELRLSESWPPPCLHVPIDSLDARAVASSALFARLVERLTRNVGGATRKRARVT